MTTNRDSDRIVRAWLDLMPDEAPTRVVATVLEEIHRLPALGRRRSRRIPVTRIHAAAAAAAAVAVVVGALMLFNPAPSGPAQVPSHAPSDAASRAPSPATSATSVQETVPPELRSVWQGSPRDVPGLPLSLAPSLQFTRNAVVLGGPDLPAKALRSSVQVTGAGEISLTTEPDAVGCPQGSTGTYRYEVTGTSRILSLSGTDSCEARSTMLTGTWLATQPCPDGGSCFGDLVAGTWRSQALDVLHGNDDLPASGLQYGALTYSVPDGWSNPIDNVGRFELTLSTEMAKLPDNRKLGLYVFPRIEPASQADGCPYAAASPAVEQSADAIASWVAERPSVVAGPAQSITVDGHHAVWLDLRLQTKWRRGCEFLGGAPYAPLFLAQRGDFGLFGAGNLEADRLVLVDVAPNRVVLIVIQSFDLTRSDAFFAAAMNVIGTFRFH